MPNFSLGAARIRYFGLVAALIFAIIIAIAITTGAFVLSFSVLRDLAIQGSMPPKWAWIFPAIVDGAILGSTVSAVLLSKISGSDDGKGFFVMLLVAVVSISVIGNAYHAYKASKEAARKVAAGIDPGFIPLDPRAAAVIAVVAPVLVLAFTHGMGILIKAIGNAYRDYQAAANEDTPQPNEHAGDGQRRTANPEAAASEDVAVTSQVGPEDEVDPTAQETGAQGEWGTADLDEMVEFESVAHLVPRVLDPEFDDDTLREAVATRNTATAGRVEDAATTIPEQTVDALIEYLDRAPDLSPEVRRTARLKICNPEMTFAAIAEETEAKAASTALRRYQKAERTALAAGFTVQLLPRLHGYAEDIDPSVLQNGRMALV
ncbi:DUF2637 domain-containing protein [Rhodococcus zopfii]|uniref:DUF2637 domain-containing protein n=1 Tax=Rhodococcus zopfii TaxID=43772 RepID=A0ABU3WTG0_9NOCA|nr:DUF2637 domain-containing protein [Rhodococcus zopfii]